MRYLVVSVEEHNRIVSKVFRERGFKQDEIAGMVKICEMAAWHGIRTHNAVKAIALDAKMGSGVGGVAPGAEIRRIPSRFKAVQRWDARRKMGPAVAWEAMEECMRMADEFGTGTVAVDNVFHYLWGGGYVIDAARKGYIAYTCCTAGTAEVVPFLGKAPTVGTNPHSWGFPTVEQVGFPVCIDWATSAVALGRVEQAKREGRDLPARCAVDKEGRETRDPFKVGALVPMGGEVAGHKGYGLAMVDELLGAYVGGSRPTMRSKWKERSESRGQSSGEVGEKCTPCFYFQCLRSEAISGEGFAFGRGQGENVREVIADILGHGNEGCLLPGELEARAAKRSAAAGGLLMTVEEVAELRKVGGEVAVMGEVEG